MFCIGSYQQLSFWGLTVVYLKPSRAGAQVQKQRSLWIVCKVFASKLHATQLVVFSLIEDLGHKAANVQPCGVAPRVVTRVYEVE